MSDLIDREAAIRKIEPWLYSKGRGESEINMLRAVVDTLKNMTAAPRWVRCEEVKPNDRQPCFVAYKGPLGFIYDSAIFYDDLNNGLGEDIFECGTGGFVLDGDVGYSLTSMDYWMPIEPPKEGE